MYFNVKDLKELDKKKRLHLINSCTGYKSANLIGTKDEKGIENLAVFSSVIHLGSDPALLGFILRPTSVPRHTFSNLLASNYFTVNHISESFYENAHFTSLKYPADVSEFEMAKLTPIYLNDFEAPFVKESMVKIGCRYINHYPIEENQTILVIGSIELIDVDDHCLEEDLFINLERAETVAINGLDAYAKTMTIKRMPYIKL